MAASFPTRCSFLMRCSSTALQRSGHRLCGAGRGLADRTRQPSDVGRLRSVRPLSETPQLQKLKDRFRVTVQLFDTDVETVIRKVIPQKRADAHADVQQVLEANAGEVPNSWKAA